MVGLSHYKLKHNARSVLMRQRAKNERFAVACKSCAGVSYGPPLKQDETTLDDIEYYYAQENNLRQIDLHNKRIMVSAHENLSPSECAFSNMKISMHNQTVAGMRQASNYGSRLKSFLDKKRGMVAY